MALPRDSFGRTYNNFRMGSNGNPIDAFFGLAGMAGASRSQFQRALSALGSARSARTATNADADFARIISHIRKIKSMAAGIGGTHSADLVRDIDRELSRLDTARGKQSIGQYFTSNRHAATGFLGTIGDAMHRAGINMGGTAEGRMFGSTGRFLRGQAVNMLNTGGLGKAMGISNILDKQAFKWEGFEKLRSSTSQLEQWFTDTAHALANSGLADTVKTIRDDLVQDMGKAKTMQEQSAAIEKATQAVGAASGTATGADKSVMKNLSDNMSAATEVAKKDTKLRQKGLPITQRFMQGIFKTGRLLGGLYTAGGPVMAMAKGAWEIGKKLHDFVEGRSAMQIGITSQRARFGRYLYGTNINHGDLMGAVATGRRAGVADSEVMQMMGALGKQLAASRWGEGGLIEKIGRWGGTPWNPNGTMMNPHQMQVQISQMMNRMTDKEEKLQFLYDMGYGPEKFEYFENYARDAQRTEAMKRNKNLRGVLEDAQIFDESGMSRRVDAYTQLVLKRREIQKQNAYDRGIWAGLAEEYLNPEQWFFSKTTARQSGVAQAKGEQEMRRLTDAIKELINVEKGRGQNGGNGGGGKGGGNGGEQGAGNNAAVATPPSFSSFEQAENFLESYHAMGMEADKNLGGNSAFGVINQQLDMNARKGGTRSIFKDWERIVKDQDALNKWNEEHGTAFTQEELASYIAEDISLGDVKDMMKASQIKSLQMEASRRMGKAVTLDYNNIDKKTLERNQARYGEREGLIRTIMAGAGDVQAGKDIALDNLLEGMNLEKIQKKAKILADANADHDEAYYTGKDYAERLKSEFGGEDEVRAAYQTKMDRLNELMEKKKNGGLSDAEKSEMKSLEKAREVLGNAIAYYDAEGGQSGAGSSGATGPESETDKGTIGSVSDEEYTPLSNEFEGDNVNIAGLNNEVLGELGNRAGIDFSDADKLVQQSQEEADKAVKESARAVKKLGGTVFRTENAEAMTDDAELDMAHAKELAEIGSTWFKKDGIKRLTSKKGISEAATNAMNAASIKAEQAAESGNIEQSKVESGAPTEERTGTGADGGTSSTSSNDIQVTNNITVNAENSKDGTEIADKIVAVVIPKICDAVMSATKTGDGIG